MPVTNPVTQLRDRERDPRIIDPRAPLDAQVQVLRSLMNHPPRGSRVITITPKLAEWILTTLGKTGNRKRRISKIIRWSLALKDGRWQLTGDTIKFSRVKLEDGHNRLAAIVRSNTAMETHVVFGVPEDCFDVIDTGTSRNNADVMTIAAVPAPRHTAQAVRWLKIYESDNPTDRSQSFANDEVLDFYLTNVDPKRMSEAIKAAVKVGRILPTGTLAAHLYMFMSLKPMVAARLAADLAVPQGNAKKLINQLSQLRQQHLGRLHEIQVNALIIKTYLSYRDGRPLNKKELEWTSGQPYPDFGWHGISTP